MIKKIIARLIPDSLIISIKVKFSVDRALFQSVFLFIKENHPIISSAKWIELI